MEGAAEVIGDCARQFGGVRLHRQIEIVGGSLPQAIAHGAAHEPYRAAPPGDECQNCLCERAGIGPVLWNCNQ